MSGRFILALAGIALLVPFFFLPPGIIATVLLIVGALALVVSLAEACRQLFYDVCWMTRRLEANLFHLPRHTGEAGRGRATSNPRDRQGS